jgi:molybdopterin molybdotransferase
MDALSFEQARAVIAAEVPLISAAADLVEHVPLELAAGRTLAEDIVADRDYPPFNRAARDGFAVRSADIATPPSRLSVIGETRAGEPSRYRVNPGEAVEIMTGAPGPEGADCVVMVEYTSRDGNHVVIEQSLPPGRNFVGKGSESAARTAVLRAGSRLEYPQIAVLASVGKSSVAVFRQPRVAILSTGDEVVDIELTPESFQIRNSNAYSLAAQVWRRGGIPEILPIAPDRLEETRALVEVGLRADMLLLSGGVSMGKYDLVEDVFADLGAELFFTQVLIQPGKPLVFGRAAGKPFFGLPGNPISTMVTFEIFGSLALARLAGVADASLPFTEAVLAEDFRHNPSLTRFLPARLDGEYGQSRVSPVKWQGSGDLASIAKANCFQVASADRESWDAGERIAVLPL